MQRRHVLRIDMFLFLITFLGSLFCSTCLSITFLLTTLSPASIFFLCGAAGIEIKLLADQLSMKLQLKQEADQEFFSVLSKTTQFLMLEKKWECDGQKKRTETLQKLTKRQMETEALMRLAIIFSIDLFVEHFLISSF
jgi:hypothetical protein